MALQGYGSVPPRIGKIAPGRGIIAGQIARGPSKGSIQKPPPMKTAKVRLGKPRGRY